MTKDKSQPDLTELAHKTQALFMGNGAGGAQFEKVLEMQDRLLREAETFTRQWFERRHEATETALKTLQEANSNGAADPTQAMRAMADWQRGSIERLSEDLRDWTALCMRCADTAKAVQLEAALPDAEKGKAAGESSKSSSKSKSGAAAKATPV
ncbi:MAG: hypothetical protein EA407_13500 [Rhodobacteraceae bacterium]|nr:MAG: hypothetical protein EA407_13500 [Paracoccaceae bacterium]